MSWPESIRELVVSRACGKCEYCLLDHTDAVLPHEVDHVISKKHGGTGGLSNLAFACFLCNRYKGSDIGIIHLETGEFQRLFHPRRDRWANHFQIVGPVLEPLTAIGQATAQLLRLNIAPRISERHLLQMLARYPVE